MSHKNHYPNSHHHHHNHNQTERSQQDFQRRIFGKDGQLPPDSNSRAAYHDDQGNVAITESPSRKSSKNTADHRNLQLLESADVILQDDKPENNNKEPEYTQFHEAYGQENNVRSSSNEQLRGRVMGHRSRSLPPGSSERKSRNGASFPYDDLPADSQRLLENVVSNEYIRNDAEADARRSQQQALYDEDIPGRGRSPTKKVSYEQTEETKSMALRKQNLAVQCRFRQECLETDDSDHSIPCTYNKLCADREFKTV